MYEKQNFLIYSEKFHYRYVMKFFAYWIIHRVSEDLKMITTINYFSGRIEGSLSSEVKSIFRSQNNRIVLIALAVICAVAILFLIGRKICFRAKKPLEDADRNLTNVERYKKAAEQGDAISQYNLGVYYENGQGVAKDEAKAVEWFSKAAEQGNVHAQYNLGLCYQDGRGVAKDEAKAVEWFKKAAKQGDKDARRNLGDCYEHGRGIAADKAKAKKWYIRAEDYITVYRRLQQAISIAKERKKREKKAAKERDALAQSMPGNQQG